MIRKRKATFFEATAAMLALPTLPRGAPRSWSPEWDSAAGSSRTNIPMPMVSAVTKIERDHMKLPATRWRRSQIEKAGIAKPGVPLVIGETRPRWWRSYENRRSRRAGRTGRTFGCCRRITSGKGRSGAGRAASAPQCRSSPRILMRHFHPLSARAGGHKSADSPGRGCRGGLIGAANGCSTSRTTLTGCGRWSPRSGMLVCRVRSRPRLHSRRQGLAEMLVRLDSVIDRGIRTIAPTAAGRGWDIELGCDAGSRTPTGPTEGSMEPGSRFSEALAQVQEGAGTVLVTGSFHTVGDDGAIRMNL